MNIEVYEKLKGLAQKKKTIFYQELCNECGLGLDMGNKSDINRISKILDEISLYENNANRPFLSALVISKKTN